MWISVRELGLNGDGEVDGWVGIARNEENGRRMYGKCDERHG